VSCPLSLGLLRLAICLWHCSLLLLMLLLLLLLLSLCFCSGGSCQRSCFLGCVLRHLHLLGCQHAYLTAQQAGMQHTAQHGTAAVWWRFQPCSIAKAPTDARGQRKTIRRSQRQAYLSMSGAESTVRIVAC
jgi:hypothetical protein